MDALHTKIIISQPRNSWKQLRLKKVWQYRSLILAFVTRDIKSQYAQTRLGIAWSFIQAITAALVINLFFGVLIRIDTGEVPYILYAFPGMMAWYYFSYIINQSGTSLVQSQHIIKKIYFPKLILPIYKTTVGLVEHLIWLVVFFALMLLYGFPVGLNLVVLPFFIFLNIIAGLSVALWLSALTVRYRDATHIIPFLIGFGVFVTPVFYKTAMIPAAYSYLIYFNPMAGVIAGYRWCLLGTPPEIQYLYGLIPVIVLLVSGLYYFRRIEGIMADVI
ncbi:MAG: ABC transporter permease [Bacteroidales bacterium]|nr:ABC transporter permease [Bacteroidales bacterium]